ncbi:maltokinase N-terminal cap-like domain-containing protein [Verrucomicrobium spinosum]|uniref:maltokinase N-terminal cap-like domain-containing protein n=1 Tax=Verrucomicrobium spinosum TaxID=2736 RepID=UPI0001746B04|nr:trehalose synthase [Verrucomicrobium spinosum]
MTDPPETDAIKGIDLAGRLADWPKMLVTHLETQVLPEYFFASRWFGGKRRTLQQLRVIRAVPGPWPGEVRLFIAEVTYADSEREEYLLPLAVVSKVQLDHEVEGKPATMVSKLGPDDVLVDALTLPAFRAALLAVLSGADTMVGGLKPAGEGLAAALEEYGSATRFMSVEQSNASVAVGPRLWLKVYRKLERGQHVEVEVMKHLHCSGAFAHIPPVHGSLSLSTGQGESTVAVLMERVGHVGDGWASALNCLAKGFDELMVGDFPGSAAVGREFPAPMQRFLARARQLGRRTGELHGALALPGGEGRAFAPEPWTAEDAQQLQQATRDAVERLLASLQAEAAARPPEWAPLASRILKGQDALLARMGMPPSNLAGGQKIRIHGDLHLAQVLDTGVDFVFIDFEGEPSLAMNERRFKRPALKDVAGMLRSFQYAAAAALKNRSTEERLTLEEVAMAWASEACRNYLKGYRETAEGRGFLPDSALAFEDQLSILLLEKVAAEVQYELSYRPSWADIPLGAVCSLINPDKSAFSNSL